MTVRTDPLVIAGPTGSGKSALALALAERLNGEIIGCDSVQLYRGFDIGSAKPTPAELARVPHHLIDVLDPADDCDAALYAGLARAAIVDVAARGRLPIIVGGTGLYLRALLGTSFHADLPKDESLRNDLRALRTDELYGRLVAADPARAAALHPNDRFRVVRALELVTLLGKPVSALGAPPSPVNPLAARIFVLDPDRGALHAAIAARTHAMLAAGLVAEVERLLAAGVPAEAKPMQSIGYKQAALYLSGTLAAAALPDAVMAATRQYAKRQTTWFRKVDGTRLAAWTVDEVLNLLASPVSRSAP